MSPTPGEGGCQVKDNQVAPRPIVTTVTSVVVLSQLGPTSVCTCPLPIFYNSACQGAAPRSNTPVGKLFLLTSGTCMLLLVIKGNICVALQVIVEKIQFD